MNERSASHRLARMWLFKLLQDAGQDVCFRCGKRIETLTEFTTDHKQPWLHASPVLFWDLTNLAASHRRCNSGARRSGQKKKYPDRKTGKRVAFSRMYSDPVKKAAWNKRRRERYRLKRLVALTGIEPVFSP
jgi:hypothetical protein